MGGLLSKAEESDQEGVQFRGGGRRKRMAWEEAGDVRTRRRETVLITPTYGGSMETGSPRAAGALIKSSRIAFNNSAANCQRSM